MDEIDFIIKVCEKLTKNQRNTIMSLDGADYVMLGCAEPTAKRLCVPTNTRPAMAQTQRISDGPVFRLTEFGVMIKNQLADMAEVA